MSRLIYGVMAALICASGVLAQGVSGLARYEGGGFTDSRFSSAVQLQLDLSQGVPWRVFTLDEPRRLVVEFREVDWTGADAQAMDQSDAVTKLRMGALQPGWSRLVAVLDAPLAVDQAGLRVDQVSGKARLDIALQPVTEEAFAEAAGVPPHTGWTRPKARLVKPAPKAPGAPLVIVLDPGHGGIDPGAERDGSKEADLVLRFALELREVLLRTGRYEVVMTRDTDRFVSLEARISVAHAAGADLFMSLHADAIEAGRAHGASVYTLSPEASDAASAALAERHDRDDLLSGVDLSGADDRVADVLMDLARLDSAPRSRALARHLVDGIQNALGHVHKKPLREAGFSVLKSADIPSVLVELGFLSTQADLDNLRDPIWRAGMAAGLRDGIAAWAIEDAALGRLRRQ